MFFPDRLSFFPLLAIRDILEGKALMSQGIAVLGAEEKGKSADHERNLLAWPVRNLPATSEQPLPGVFRVFDEFDEQRRVFLASLHRQTTLAAEGSV